MPWFSFLQSTDYATPNLVYPPLKRIIDLDDLNGDIYAGDIVVVPLNGKKINKSFSSTLTEVQTPGSFIVVYEDDADETFFQPVRSRIVEDNLYFEPYEQYLQGYLSSKYYAIYYGLNNLKYLTLNDDQIYQQIDTVSIESVEDGQYFELTEEESWLGSLRYVNLDSSEKYTLALYNNGIDWVDNRSQKIGAKAFGFFDAPLLSIYGTTGPDMGSFRIRILKMSGTNEFTKNIILDWQTVDCYGKETVQYQELFQFTDFPDDGKYMFEIETVLTENSKSTSPDVIIDGYWFVPNYSLTIQKEQIYEGIAFIRIGGIK